MALEASDAGVTEATRTVDAGARFEVTTASTVTIDENEFAQQSVTVI